MLLVQLKPADVACGKATLRTSPSSGQASTSSPLHHPTLLACHSGQRWGYDTHSCHNDPPAPAAPQPGVLAVARRHGASNLRIYGSIAKGQEHNGSDLDLLVDLAADQTLLGLIRLRQELEDLLGCPVDVTEAETLHPLIRSEILAQAQLL